MSEQDLAAVLAALRSHAWPLLAALVIGAIVRLLKADVGWTPTVPPNWRAALAFGLGLAGGAAEAIVAGLAIDEAILRGAFAGVAAIAGHKLLVEKLRSGRELFAPVKVAAVPAGYADKPPEPPEPKQ